MFYIPTGKYGKEIVHLEWAGGGGGGSDYTLIL